MLIYAGVLVNRRSPFTRHSHSTAGWPGGGEPTQASRANLPAPKHRGHVRPRTITHRREERRYCDIADPIVCFNTSQPTTRRDTRFCIFLAKKSSGLAGNLPSKVVLTAAFLSRLAAFFMFIVKIRFKNPRPTNAERGNSIYFVLSSFASKQSACYSSGSKKE